MRAMHASIVALLYCSFLYLNGRTDLTYTYTYTVDKCEPSNVHVAAANQGGGFENSVAYVFIQPALRQEWSWMFLHGPQCAFEMSMFKCVLQFTL